MIVVSCLECSIQEIPTDVSTVSFDGTDTLAWYAMFGVLCILLEAGTSLHFYSYRLPVM